MGIDMSSVQQALKYDPILRRMIISDVESHGDAVEIGYTHIFNKPGTTIGYAKGLYVKRYEGITRLVESVIGYENQTSASGYYLPFIVPTDILGSSISIDLAFSDTTSGLSIYSVMTANGPTLQFDVNNFAGSLINYDPVTNTDTTDILKIFSAGLKTDTIQAATSGNGLSIETDILNWDQLCFSIKNKGKSIIQIGCFDSGLNELGEESVSTAGLYIKSPTNYFGSVCEFKMSSDTQEIFSIEAMRVEDGKSEVVIKAGNASILTYNAYNDSIISSTSYQINNRFMSKSISYRSSDRGSVIQNTSKSSGVGMNAPHGEITMNNAELTAGSSVTFTLSNSEISLGDFVLVDIQSGATDGAYEVKSKNCAAGSCQILLKNVSGGALSEAVVIKFFVFKSPIPA
jgi:hypothetical protein